MSVPDSIDRSVLTEARDCGTRDKGKHARTIAVSFRILTDQSITSANERAANAKNEQAAAQTCNRYSIELITYLTTLSALPSTLLVEYLVRLSLNDTTQSQGTIAKRAPSNRLA